MKATAPKTLQIRTAHANDAKALAELSGQLGYPATQEEILRRLPRLATDKEHLVLVAEREGQVVGWTHGRVSQLLTADPYVEIAALVVAEAYRGAGIGRLLVARLEEWAREKKCSAVRVRTNVIRERARVFYEILGYAKLKTQHFFHKSLVTVVALLSIAFAAAAQSDVEATLSHGGRERTYRVHVPRGYDTKKPVPLVLALHGGGGQAPSMISLTRLNDVADRYGFLVVYPDGVFRRWNDGRQSGIADSRTVDDVAFLSALIDALAREYRIDLKRVYATGMSNGGFMSQRLACDLSDKIAAIAPVAATMGRDLSARCKPSRPVSVLLIHGTEDPLVPYEGGRVQVRGGGAIISADAAIRKWVELNGCNAKPKVSDLPDKADDGTRTRRDTYSGCRQGSEVVLLRVEGGGHTWPSGPQYLPQGRIGRTSRDFEASEEIWQFFARHAGSR